MGIELTNRRRCDRIWQINEGWQLDESSIRRISQVGYPNPYNLCDRSRNEMADMCRNGPVRREIGMTNLSRNRPVRWEIGVTNISRNRPVQREIEMTKIPRKEPILPKYDSSYRSRNPPMGNPYPNCVYDLWGNEMSSSLRKSPIRPVNEMSYNRRNSLVWPVTEMRYIRLENEMSCSCISRSIPPAGYPIPHRWAPIESVTVYQNVTRTETIVNLRKSTLCLENDEDNPGYHLLDLTLQCLKGVFTRVRGWGVIFFQKLTKVFQMAAS